MKASKLACAEVDLLHIGLNYVNVPKNAPQRIHNIARRKISRRHLMEHGSEEDEVLPSDQRHVYIRSSGEVPIELFGGIQPGESTASDHNPHLLHVTTFCSGHGNVKDSVSLLSIGRKHTSYLCASDGASFVCFSQFRSR